MKGLATRGAFCYASPDMKNAEIQAVVWKEGRQYVSQCLNVDVASYGSTEKAALDNLREALELYFEGKRTRRPTRVRAPSVVSLKLRYA